MNTNKKLNSTDNHFLSLCVDLAEEALEAGDKPFGSILVDKEGTILAQARNRINELNALAENDGFDNWSQMKLWFDNPDKQYFGKIIFWKNFELTANDDGSTVF